MYREYGSRTPGSRAGAAPQGTREASGAREHPLTQVGAVPTLCGLIVPKGEVRRMRRTRAWTAGVLVVGLGVAALAGCSSSDGKDSADPGRPSGSAAPPSASASASTTAAAPAPRAPAGKGHLDYSGARSGGFDAKDTTCVTAGDRLVSVATADPQRLKSGDGPGFSATLAGGASVVTLVTADGHTYVTHGAAVSGRKAGNAWVVFVTDAKLTAAGGSGSITVNGTLSCVHLKGA